LLAKPGATPSLFNLVAMENSMTPPPRTRSGARTVRLAALLAALVPALAAAQAQSVPDVQNLEPQLPAEVDDAELIPSGGREVQLPNRMTREQDRDNRFLIEPRFQWGFAQRFQATLGVPLIVGSSDRTNSGNVRGDLLYKLLDEGSLLPAVAVGGGLELPTGKNAAGTDVTLEVLATKTLGERPGTHRIHGNFIYRINDDARAGERDDTVRWILGYSTPLTDSTVVVADVVRGHGRLGATSMSTLWEVGLRHQWQRGTIVSLGLATGSGDDAPDWAITAGLQQQF
jgi:hypothetical protein